MKRAHVHVVLHILLIAGVLVSAIEPITTAFVVGSAAVGTYKYFSKYFVESCDSRWISFNATGLQTDLENKLFGQHIASDIIFKAVKGFMSNENPNKPLVLSLHGWTGTGKNFVSKLIADNIYKEGMDSKYVHMFTSTLHFPHPSQNALYKAQLQKWIKGNVSNCERSMFIFDEMDKMQPGLIDSIKPYLDYYVKLDGVSYRKSIFIFLSNAGGDSIIQTALDFWKAGRDREEIKLRDLETSLSLSVFNNKESGFFRTSLIDKHMVDFFVPFLPLEYKHIVQCTMAEMRNRDRKPDQDVADMVARDLVYFPKSERVFSVKGCKTIETKLDYYT
ncbi:torsin family 1 isoform X2 [Cololabis saira]|uniref:torsin family 1 isoform X2 n=1 Tax=Cololabis saira TaxID=129043 RepID=UPI002AD49340|nr:torsin family 1 isoform X2 [Cololabis saira]